LRQAPDADAIIRDVEVAAAVEGQRARVVQTPRHAAVGGTALAAFAGDGADHTALDLAHARILLIGHVDRAVGGHGQAFGAIELRLVRRAVAIAAAHRKPRRFDRTRARDRLHVTVGRERPNALRGFVRDVERAVFA